MSQQVNFLNSIPKPQRQVHGSWIIIAGIVTFIALLVWSMVLGFNQYTIHQQLTAAEQSHQQATAAYQRLAQAYPLLASDTPLVTKIAILEKELEAKQAQFNQLTHTTFRRPFSSYLVALSKTAPNGLWLTGININQDSGNISLAGSTTEPILITVFLKMLQEIPPFTKEIFELFSVRKNLKKGGLHEFTVANKQLIDEVTNNDK